MIPVDLRLDVMPLATDPVVIRDEALQGVSRDVELPPFGLGVELPEVIRPGRFSIGMAAGASLWGGHWDLGFDHVVSSWQIDLDVVFRLNFSQDLERSYGFLTFGAGPRASVLVQSWWDDYLYGGLGGFGGFGGVFGKGPYRVIAGGRLIVTAIPARPAGTFAGPVGYTWEYWPANLRAGVYLGVGFR